MELSDLSTTAISTTTTAAISTPTTTCPGDPFHFFTAPGLSWEAALKMTKIELELMTNYEMHLFMEEGIRGGVSTITHRYAEANNHYMDNFNETKPETYLIYWDANNLYGYAMSQKLPTSNFRWLSEEEIENLEIENLDKEGFIFEVHLGKSLQLFKIIFFFFLFLF